ncbi:hypothetical protein Ae168Ps1_0069 [Pseudonocardia sp. Ae168_Ps1]|nr:hypothetical protein Ae150APs1_0066 [Pseudonocardia sp. Ae150A_Ps1]OLL77663.1 hypothetical protein Ae168Ps1_0069 [Pseudonocardia sp. Ae168_Ps1]OLL91756.1 hypothetical protein Ae356Ps1_1653 [Pseudonocardia sp. Ae356_Ps1]
MRSVVGWRPTEVLRSPPDGGRKVMIDLFPSVVSEVA